MTRKKKCMAIVAALLCLGLASTASAQSRSFAWYAEMVSVDQAAKAITVKAQLQPAAAGYLKQYKPGDRIVLIWEIDGAKGGEADTVLAMATPEEMKVVDVGYITRVDFVAGDAAGKTLTFKTTVPDAVLQSVATVQPGKWIKVTAPMEQPGPNNTLASAMPTEKPAPKPPRPKPEPAAAAADGGRRGGPPAVKASGGISGAWTIALSLAGNDLKNECDLAQDGPKLGGVCKTPGGDSPVTGLVTGPKVSMSFAVNLGGMDLDFAFSGTVDAAGTKMTGTVTVLGMEADFTGMKK